MIVGSSLTLVENIPTIISGRFLQGISGVALNFSVVQRIIYEIAPINLRAVAGSFNNVIIFSGYFILVIFGYWVPAT